MVAVLQRLEHEYLNTEDKEGGSVPPHLPSPDPGFDRTIWLWYDCCNMRDARIVVRVTEREKEIIAEKAKQAGLKPSTFLRLLGLTMDVEGMQVAPEQEDS